ncbi:MAG: hypothetical protein NTW69_06460 [Chloroflexi bacterium]|nr:hypothetical protein [Chloroflexota bacterium]
MNVRQKKRLIHALQNISEHQAIYFLLKIYCQACFGFIRNRRHHWLGNRAPRLVFLASYLFIIWVVVATAILIAAQNIQLGIIMFGLFVVPLYAVTRYASGFSKRAHWGRGY